MFVVGLTGGIGSGKSAASDFFEQQGIRVVDADVVAREVVEPGEAALNKIQEHFGNEVISADGQLNRAALRQIIFNKPEAKSWLESLLHPLIRQRMEQQLASAESPYAILSAPLLLEGELHHRCDRVLVIDIPEALQIERSCDRDQVSVSQIQAIIGSQISREHRLQKADDVIDNSGSLEDLQQQVEALHQQYLNYAKQ
jgi:dephospho-CoA kinase